MGHPSSRSIGDIGEHLATRYLIQKGYTIIESNYQIKGGEIDIICRSGTTYIFVEVRYRKNDTYGHPLDTLSYTKRQTLKRAIMRYIGKYKIDPEQVRIDCIGIIPEKDTHAYQYWHMEGIDI